MPDKLDFHHLGVACHSLDNERLNYEALGYAVASATFEDPGQKIRGFFMEAPGQPRLELLENLHPAGPLDDWLKRGVKIYHTAYAVSNIEESLEFFIRKHGVFVVTPVMEAVYFRKVCFFMFRNMSLVELVLI